MFFLPPKPEGLPETPDPAKPPKSLTRRMVPALVCLLVIGGLVALSLPVMRKQRPVVDRTRAIGSLKQISTALFDFDQTYGSFPGAGTIDAVIRDTKPPLLLGDASSNQLFRQMLDSLKTEGVFWTPAAKGMRKPDDDFSPGKALEPGECGFGYVAGLSDGGDGDAPIVFAPLVPGTRRFDPEPYAGQAVVLFLDNSVKAMRIDAATGLVMLPNGMDLFDPRQPYWKSKAPEIKLPEWK